MQEWRKCRGSFFPKENEDGEEGLNDFWRADEMEGIIFPSKNASFSLVFIARRGEKEIMERLEKRFASEVERSSYTDSSMNVPSLP